MNSRISIVDRVVRQPKQTPTMFGQRRIGREQLKQQIPQIVSPWNRQRSLAHQGFEIFFGGLLTMKANGVIQPRSLSGHAHGE